MRIEAYTQVQQIYKETSKVKAGNNKKTVGRFDELQLSSIGKDYQTAKQAVAAAPDVREELTAPLKASIRSGNYQVSNESFADKLLAEMR